MGSSIVATAFEFSALYVTFPNDDEARKLAKKLVSERLANFVNILPAMQTMYTETKGDNVELDSEVMIMAKIRTKQASHIIDFVTKQHPYDVAEIFAVPISAMSSLFRDNLKANLHENF